jgi:hypothetical protein
MQRIHFGIRQRRTVWPGGTVQRDHGEVPVAKSNNELEHSWVDSWVITRLKKKQA